MLFRRFSPALLGEAGGHNYLIALALIGGALVLRYLLDLFAPGVSYFIPLLPAIVVAGVFCGTAPAAIAAGIGGVLSLAFSFNQALLAGSNLTSLYIATALFPLACAVILWATDLLRSSAAAANAAEARLAEVFRQIPGAAAILEAPSGRLLMRSSRSQSVLGHVEGRLERSADLAAYGGVHRDGRSFEATDYPIVRAFRTGEVVSGERIRYRKPGDEIVDLEVHAGPVRDLAGRIVAAVGMAFDVTERMRSEQRLRDGEAEQRAMATRLRAALDIGAVGLWELDLMSGRIRLDARSAEMLGLPAEATEMIRANMKRFADPGDRARARGVFNRAIASGGEYADEVRICTATGEARWFAVRGASLAGARKFVGVVRDVTQRRQREEALQDALRARDLLMQEADHRIKNSLQLVISLLTLQANRTTDPDARHAMAQAISQVHTVADVHLGLQQTPDLRSIEIDRMLTDICNRVCSLNPKVALCHDARAEARLDAEQAVPLGLIVCELVTNALRHAFPPETSGILTLTTRSIDDTLIVTVTDNGGGMPASPRRAGLGTTVVSAMAKQIGATVEIDSKPGGGTAATIRLRKSA
jgi:PAS domain S-box-containing protein